MEAGIGTDGQESIKGYFGVAGAECGSLAELLGRLDLCKSAAALGKHAPCRCV